jgi:hypothetical protein
MIITVLSKDKISLSMFVDFYKTLYDSSAEVLDLNTLISSDMLDSIVRNAIGTNLDRATSESAAFLIKLKTKKSMIVEELPTEIKFKSDYIVQFDLFSTKPEVLKDRDGKFAPILERWEANIEKMNKQG